MQSRVWRLAFTVAACVLLASCARDQSIKPAFQGDGGQTSNIGTGRGVLDESELGPDVASAGSMRGGRLRGDSSLDTVYFEYNSAALQGAAQDTLDANGAYLRENTTLRVQIAGHCDERGTLEYNLALGERRAQSVRKYLIGKGVSADRLYTISYGEERPARRGGSESAWRLNRRAQFQVAR